VNDSPVGPEYKVGVLGGEKVKTTRKMTGNDICFPYPFVSRKTCLHVQLFSFGPRRVPKRYDGCSSWCFYRFQKMPKALLLRNGKLQNLAHTFVRSFPTDLPS